MAEKHNFVLGNGDNLTEKVAYPRRKMGEKVYPYSFRKARARLIPRAERMVEAMEGLPSKACPEDYAVSGLTLHPAFLAKSWYPGGFLREMGLKVVGSRARRIEPEQTTPSAGKGIVETVEFFIAGKRDRFRDLPAKLRLTKTSADWADDIRKLEDIRCFEPGERLRAVGTKIASPLMEVVLHASAWPRAAFILSGFRQYLESLGVEIDFSRRTHVKGLCFIPAELPKEVLPEIEKFSFLRVAREMPRLRTIRPMLRAVPGSKPFEFVLPEEGPLDPSLRVAVFDGGLPTAPDLSKWATAKECDGLAGPDAEALAHGLGVTSALLFGPLREDETPEATYAHVDHYRVIDENTDGLRDSYLVLDRIMGILRQEHYDFINLSVGPELPIDDNDIDRWTAELDDYLADGRTLAVVAAGNGGERDHALDYDRIQVPADAVNALSVGACDCCGPGWKRAKYSSIGPGRSPGIVKPDVSAFGGSLDEPYWLLGAQRKGYTAGVRGTSFAAPTALRTATAVRAHFGNMLSPLTIKALLIHRADPNEHHQAEVGWGRVPSSLEEIATCPPGTVTIVYQGELLPGKYLRAPIPLPSELIKGYVHLTATFCFASVTEPEHLPNYTRSGLDIHFRPHDQKFLEEDSMYPKTAPFFRPADMYASEIELRRKAHLWETVLHASQRKRGSSLRDPVFCIHYNARARGHGTASAESIPYTLVLTVAAAKMPDIYSKVLLRYRNKLEALRPVIEIPVRVDAG